MRFKLYSPTQTLFDGEATLVAASSVEGEFAVMDGHAPLIAQLVPAPLRIEAADGKHAFAVRGGILQVTRDEVICLAHDALPGEAIDAAALTREKDALANRPGDEEDVSEVQQERLWLAVKERVAMGDA